MDEKKSVPWEIWLLRILGLFAVFLLPLFALISFVPFNKYAGTDAVISQGIWDCDTDAEAVFGVVGCLASCSLCHLRA